VYIGKGDAENERAQVIDIRHPAETPERTFRQKMCVLTALILPRRADAAIHYSHIVEEHVRVVARTSAEFSALRPAAFGIVFGSHRSVHAAIEDPVHGFPGNLSLRGGVAETRNQQPAL